MMLQRAFTATLVLLSGCAHQSPRVDGVPGTSPQPSVLWTAPARAASNSLENGTPAAGPAVPLDEIQDRLQRLTLGDVVDVALRNNPATRAAWADAKVAAARFGAEKGAWYPTLSVDAALTRANGSSVASGARSSTTGGSNSWTTTYSGAASLSYLLFDFGGRGGDIEESKQVLLAANWTQNAVIQDRILGVEVAFFSYVGAKAILAANRTSLAEAESSLTAAEARHEMGLATIADVLQAKTARAQARLDVIATEGQERATRGALAVSMGYPANVPCDVVIDTPEIPADGVSQTVDELIETAVAHRPDLRAARARARAAGAAVESARSDLLPSLALSGIAGRSWLHDDPDAFDRYSAALTLNIPVFSGQARQYDVRAAEAEAEAAGARAQDVEQQVIYEVFASHSDFLTATARVATADELLASALASEEVALGRYREGVGDMLDLLSAQRALAIARAQQVNARLSWFTALARLARDAGVLGPRGANPLAPTGLQPEVRP